MENENNLWEEPTDSDKELVEWVVEQTDAWRTHKEQNYLKDWEKYERLFRGIWSGEDKTRQSERSRIISPATQQAIETRHAEITEAVFGNGEFFDIDDDVTDVNGTPLDIKALKAQLSEDFKKDKVRKAVDAIVLMGEIYGTGIGEVVVTEEKTYAPATQPIPGSTQAAIGIMEGTRFGVKLVPVNPRNFLIDPNADSIDSSIGVAIEKFVSIHKLVEGMEKGIYKKVDIGIDAEDDDLEPTEELHAYKDGKVKVITYYGLVPREYLEQLENDEQEAVDLFPEDSLADDYADLVEAIIVIANGNKLLKAEANPYMMKDRPVVAYQADTVPGRFWGRGTAEKAYNMQVAIDGSYRSHMDASALTTAPMVAMDATRMPRGSRFEVHPGKAILTNGDPSQILMPFNFGQVNPVTLTNAQNFERMLLQATGTIDSGGTTTPTSRDVGGAGMSMAVAGVLKKYKRTLANFQEDFLIPFVNKAAWRYMQFDPERYPSVDLNFVPTASLGIMAREYEQQQFIGLLQTLGPDTPVLPIILKGIVSNSSLSNKVEMLAALEQMMKPSPEQQQAAQMQTQLAMADQQATVEKKQAEAQKAAAEAQKAAVEAQIAPEEAKARIISALSTNLNDNAEDKDFERRMKLADLMLREEDLRQNERIVEKQMAMKAKAMPTIDNMD